MGGLTSNRKRGGDSISPSRYISTSPYFNPFNTNSSLDLHISKKPKVSSMHINSESFASSSSISLNQSTFSRIRQYPEPIKPLRSVHAPCCKPRFSSSRMGGLFSSLNEAKAAAVNTFRYVEVDDTTKSKSKNKKAVDVDVDLVSDDSIVEEEEEEGEVIVWSKCGSEKKSAESIQNQKSVETEDDVFLKEKYRSFENNDVQVSSSVVTDLSIQTTPEADKGGKMLGFVSEDRVVQELDESPYKKLYDSAQRRNSRLSHFTLQIGYLTKKLTSLRWSVKKPEKVEIQEPRKETLVPLTDEEEAEVSRALSNAKRSKLLVAHPDSNIEITGNVLQCLKPGTWLNDEVINLYLELLKEREKREPKRFLKCHFFNTFFYKKLISGKGGYDFKSVRRWTTQRKIGYSLIECDKIFVPIHKEIHWCLAIINIKDQKFQYLDSMKGRDSKVLQVLARYYVDEVKDKSAKDINVNSWDREYVSDLPAQENGFDCGMFMIKYADFYSRGLGLCFGQENMPYFRRRTAKEILRLKAE